MVLDLGLQPRADALLTRQHLDETEEKFPLELLFCDACSLLQVSVTIPPDVLFRRDYPYFSSSNAALVEHARQHVEELVAGRGLNENSFVVEVASNDGYLLQHLIARGIPVLGIDPSDGPGHAAIKKGVPTLNEYFTSRLAERLAAENKFADVIIAANVCAHVDQINDFIAGFKRLLKREGIAIFEFAYAIDTIEQCEFDQIYHEHLFYHTLTGLKNLFARHGLYLHDARHLAIHGGSLRLSVTHADHPTPRLRAMLDREHEIGAERWPYYQNFADRVERNVDALRSMLQDLKGKGRRIACYGAASKGATMLNYLNLGEGFFEFVADLSPHKQGKWMPGQNLPIVSPDKLSVDAADFCLLLAWNFKDDILAAQASYQRAGGRFILPVPAPQIIEADLQRAPRA